MTRTIQQEVDFSRTPISAIFIFHDPRNWSLDTQIICDILQSGGIIGGPRLSPNVLASGGHAVGSGDGKPIELVFCNPDLLWKNDFDSPRLGQGAFKASFLAVYKVCCMMGIHLGCRRGAVWKLMNLRRQALTGSTYPYVQYGKPTAETYKFAERVMADRFQELWGVTHLPSV